MSPESVFGRSMGAVMGRWAVLAASAAMLAGCGERVAQDNNKRLIEAQVDAGAAWVKVGALEERVATLEARVAALEAK
jgi:uncharacterized protein YceH (UPF0502 family)